MASSPVGKRSPRRSAAYDDIEAAIRDANCADSCTSLDDYARSCASPGGSSPLSSGSDDGVLEWQADDDVAAAQQAQHSSWRCRSSGLAAVCLLLTLGSFVGPDTQQRAGAMVKRAAALSSDFSSRVHEDASYQSEALIAKMKGERHCRPPPSLLRGNISEQRLHIAGLEEAQKMESWQDDKLQWLVSARLDGLLSIMTPVYPDEENLALLLNQLRSANQFLNMDSIKEWLLVAPKAKLPRLVNFLEEELVTLPCVLARKMRVVADETCAPELETKALKQIAGNMADSIDGWYKQQVVKLACSFTITTPYFLITDADTFFLDNLEALDLMRQQEGCTASSSVCDLQKQVQFRAKNEMANVWTAGEVEQEQWIARSASVLNISVPIPEGGLDTMGVTPQIMSRGVLSKMAAHIEQKLAQKGDTWRAFLLRFNADWLRDEKMKSHASWTEYDLYWTFATHEGLWDKFHVRGYLQRPEANLWWEEQYPDWDPCAKFDDGDEHGFWAVVQSRLDISAALIWDKLAPCMQHSIASGRNLTIVDIDANSGSGGGGDTSGSVGVADSQEAAAGEEDETDTR